MNKKLILTSIVALGFARPVMATVPTASSTFPDASKNQYMQENYVYTNAATDDNMDGVYQNNATVYAVAQYDDVLYSVIAGNYLPMSSESVRTCDSGYFCPGLSSQVQYSETQNQGRESCPSGYDSSVSGATAATQCYASCDSSILPHASSVSGNAYYNVGFASCVASSCDSGWHVESGALSGTELVAKIGSAEALDSAIMTSGFISFSETNYNGNKPYTASCANSSDSGCDPDEIIWESSLPYYGMVDADSAWAVHFNTSNQTSGGDPINIVRGDARLSNVAGSGLGTANPTMLTTQQLGTGTGNNCYCKVTAYESMGVWYDLVSPWVYAGIIGNGDDGACYSLCTGNLGSASSNLRSVLLGSATGKVCNANRITVDWGNSATSTEISVNHAGYALYGKDVRTPRSATPKPGKTFKGWRFSSVPSTNQ